jgi:hypothetical protein
MEKKVRNARGSRVYDSYDEDFLRMNFLAVYLVIGKGCVGLVSK